MRRSPPYTPELSTKAGQLQLQMSIVAIYAAVPPADLERARHDERTWRDVTDSSAYPTCYLGGRYSTLWYLLDPARRRASTPTDTPEEPETLRGQAIVGARLVSEQFSAAYEDPPHHWVRISRCLSPEEVRATVTEMEALTRDQLFEHYDPEAMRHAVVPRLPLEMTWELFEKLKMFYHAAAERGDGVVIHIS